MMLRYIGWRLSMSSIRRPADRVTSDAIRDIGKKLDDIVRRLGIIETNITTITSRLESGDVDFT